MKKHYREKKKQNVKKIYFSFSFIYKFIFIFFLFLMALFILFYKKRRNTNNNYVYKSSWEKERLIVHALGKINTTIYSNTLEALKYWYFEKNMRLMEADFHLTSDNHVVLTHDFSILGRIPTLEEFKKYRLNGYLTRISFEDLVIFMEQHNDLYIITDTKFDDIYHIQIEFDEMIKILSRHKNVNE